MKNKKILFPLILASLFSMSACGNETNNTTSEGNNTEHVHHWSDEWSYDDDKHWHDCSDCDEVKDEAPHAIDEVGNCSVCDYYLGTDILFHQTVEFGHLNVGEKLFYRFFMPEPVKILGDYMGAIQSDDISLYRVNESDQYELVTNINRVSYNLPAESKNGYYYIVVSPVSTAVDGGSLAIEDDHLDLSNLDDAGYCKHVDNLYTGIEITDPNIEFLLTDYIGEFDSFFRFKPKSGKAYHIELKPQLSHHGIEGLFTYSRNSEGVCSVISSMPYFDPHYESSCPSTNYYDLVNDESLDGYVYIHLQLEGVNGEEFTEDDFVKLIEESK